MRPIRLLGVVAAIVAGVVVWSRSHHAAAVTVQTAGLTLPAGFHAAIFADNVGPARHFAVAPNGDMFLAVAGDHGGLVALRDTNGDGTADTTVWISHAADGSDVHLVLEHPSYIYFSTNTTIVRFPWIPGSLTAAGTADTIVRDLPATGDHVSKSFVLAPDGALYVNIGSATNACQHQNREPGSPGYQPCTELETRAGIWKFDANKTDQRQADGVHFATGLRNTVAFTRGPDGTLYGVMHGRDQLSNNWPKLFNDSASAEKPSEEFVHIEQGDDFGWPYCYHDPALGHLVLAPEYGGDGHQVGVCAQKKEPMLAFPAHWAPDGLVFYTDSAFPAAYRGGAFIAFHGSWNRAPLPQQGYKVVFVPFADGRPVGTYQTFSDGFRGASVEHRPVGLGLGPHGALFVSDDRGGRIYKITYGT